MLDSTSKVLEDSARGGLYLTLGNVVSGVISALSLMVIARILGSEQYGLYTISTVAPSLLILFVDPGINQAIVKFSANFRVKGDQKRLRTLLTHSLLVEACLGLVASLICFIFSDYLAIYVLNRPEIGGLIRLASALVIFQSSLLTMNSVFIGMDKAEYNTITTVIQAIIKAIAAPVLLVLGFSIIGAIIGYVLSFIFSCLIGVFLIVRIYHGLNQGKDSVDSFSSNMRMLIHYGLPLYVSVIIGGFILQYRNILLSIFTSNYEIGNFQAAMNFNTIINSISVPIATMLLPAFSKMEGKSETLKEFFKMSVKYTSLIILPITSLLMIYSGEAIRILYGDTYSLSSYFLVIFMVTYFLVGLGFNTLISFFNGIGQTKISFKINLLNSATMMFLAPLATFLYGAAGLIVIIVLSSLVSTLYGQYVARKSFKIDIDKRMMAQTYSAVIATALLVIVVKTIIPCPDIISLMIGGFTYFAVYLLMLPVTGIITKTEIEEISKIINRIQLFKYVARPILHYEQIIFRLYGSNRKQLPVK